MKRIVLTGGACSGKTALINHFRNCGYVVVDEAAIQVIESLHQLLGYQAQKDWRDNYTPAFQDLIWKKIIQLELAADKGAEYIFFDRGIFDGLAYLPELTEKEKQAFQASYARHAHYTAAYVLQTLPDFQRRKETGRTTGYDESCATGEELYRIYQAQKIYTARVPVMELQQRANWILTDLSQHMA